MTATADSRLRREIIRSLTMRRTQCITLPMTRENLVYSVVGTLDRDAEIRRLVQRVKDGRVLIYCGTRRRAEAVSHMLARQGVPALYYHAGMDDEARRCVQESFTSGACTVVAATIAFGMGVDVPDVRMVVHDTLPADILAYAQETGRAGRDGLPARCVLLMDPAMLAQRRKQIAALRTVKDKPWWERIRSAREMAKETQRILTVVMGAGCVRSGISRAFGWREMPCGKCPRCLGATEGGVGAVPPLWRMTHKQLALWMLQRHRAVLDKRGQPHNATDEALLQAVKTGLVPESVFPAARSKLQRILDLTQRM